MTDLICTLIVDDEPLNRAELRYLLSQHADVEIVGEAETVDGARTAIARHRPELVLLDIRIDSGPGGLELAAWIDGHAPATHVVFVTAHPEHALEAYDHHPAHFLVKPIDDSKLAEALGWVRRSARRPEGAGRLAIRYHERDRSGETIRPTAYLRPSSVSARTSSTTAWTWCSPMANACPGCGSPWSISRPGSATAVSSVSTALSWSTSITRGG